MGQVNIVIAGRSYRMACDDGQESHLLALGEEFETLVGTLKKNFGEIGDNRLVVMAGIMMADRLDSERKRSAQLSDDLASLREARAALLERLDKQEADLAREIRVVNDHIVGVIEKLESDERF